MRNRDDKDGATGAEMQVQRWCRCTDAGCRGAGAGGEEVQR